MVPLSRCVSISSSNHVLYYSSSKWQSSLILFTASVYLEVAYHDPYFETIRHGFATNKHFTAISPKVRHYALVDAEVLVKDTKLG